MRTHRATVLELILGIALIVIVVGIVLLAMRHEPIPDVLQNLALADLTGLLGVQVPRPRRSAARRRA